MIIKTNTKGYNYKYTDLAGINETLEKLGMSYIQKTETDEKNGNDYVWTKLVYQDNKESEWVRGAKIVDATLQGKSNPAQEYGSALTYARRYSLLMTLGIATTDDDGECLTKKVETKKVELATKEQIDKITELAKELKLEPEQSIDDLAHFKKSGLKDLTTLEANSYIKILQQRIAKGGKNGK